MSLQVTDSVKYTSNVPSLPFGGKVPGFVWANIPNFKESLYNIDYGIAILMWPRDDISRKIGAYKKSQWMPILSPEREAVVKSDMFECLKVKAHKVKHIWQTRIQSDRFLGRYNEIFKRCTKSWYYECRVEWIEFWCTTRRDRCR